MHKKKAVQSAQEYVKNIQKKTWQLNKLESFFMSSWMYVSTSIESIIILLEQQSYNFYTTYTKKKGVI